MTRVEVKIGVQQARELVLESTLTPEQVAKAVSDALSKGGLLSLTDDKGRSVHVPAEKLAYVEIGEPSERRVGFGVL